jgi:hypothetical protein
VTGEAPFPNHLARAKDSAAAPGGVSVVSLVVWTEARLSGEIIKRRDGGGE